MDRGASYFIATCGGKACRVLLFYILLIFWSIWTLGYLPSLTEDPTIPYILIEFRYPPQATLEFTFPALLTP